MNTQRFEVRENTPNSWGIYDNDAKKYDLPDRVTSMYMRKDAADKIAEIMNKEWSHFVNHPS